MAVLDFEVDMTGDKPKYTFDLTREIDGVIDIKDDEDKTYAEFTAITGNIYTFTVFAKGQIIGLVKFLNNLFFRYEQYDLDYPFSKEYTTCLNISKPGRKYKITEFNKLKLINRIMQYNKDAKYEVCRFIADFVYCASNETRLVANIYDTFMNGYCYYFAIMLKDAFNRGDICWCAPYGHFVWMDTDDVPYDICGVNHDDCDYYIPISYIGDGVNDFKHVIGKVFNADDKFIKDCIEKYKKDKGDL